MKTLASFPSAWGARRSGQAGKSVSIACYSYTSCENKPILFLFVVLALKRAVFMMINYLYHLLHLILKMPASALMHARRRPRHILLSNVVHFSTSLSRRCATSCVHAVYTRCCITL